MREGEKRKHPVSTVIFQIYFELEMPSFFIREYSVLG